MAAGSEFIINFGANVEPIEAAMRRLGATGESVFARLNAAATSSVAVPAGVGLGSDQRLGQILTNAGSLGADAFNISTGRIDPEVRRSFEEQIRSEIKRLGTLRDNSGGFVGITGPKGGATRGGDLLLERAAVLEEAALRQLREIIAAREGVAQLEIERYAVKRVKNREELALLDAEIQADRLSAESAKARAAEDRKQAVQESLLNDQILQGRKDKLAEDKRVRNLQRQGGVLLSPAALEAERNLGASQAQAAGTRRSARIDEDIALTTSEEYLERQRILGDVRARATAEQRVARATSTAATEAAVTTRLASESNRITAAQAALANEGLAQRRIQLARQQGIDRERNRAAREEAALIEVQNQQRKRGLFGRLAAGGGFGGGFGGSVDRAGGLGGFFGGGLASTLRFAVPSALLFGAATGIAGIVRQAEELEQIFVRLEAQFASLGSRGIFGGDSPEEQARRATEALDEYRQEIFSIARDTGLATDQTAELGQQFIGLFSSINTGDVQGLAEQATRITAEFSIITGLNPEETFNDLAGSVRSFGDTGEEVLSLIDNLTDSVINVSDATGVSAGEITDFVGRIGPAAAQAGLALEEIIALGATALQGSGVGGAALAEQFARILTGLQGELGVELSRLALEFEDTFRNIDVGGETVADMFNVDTVAAGEVDRVLKGLIEGFDELSESQQRQIVASIGSRREGNTLAAVLQNAATYTTALDAATSASGERQERFALIIERLTGQVSRLRENFVQLGLDLFNAGLADIFSGLISTLDAFVNAASVAIEVGSALGAVFDQLPDGFAETVVQLGLLVGGFRLLSRFATARLFANLAGPTLAGVASRFGLLANNVSAMTLSLRQSVVGVTAQTTALGRLGAAAGLAGRGISTLLGAIGPVNLAIAAGAIAWSTFRNEQEQANRAAERAAERQERMGEILSSTEDRFTRAARAAEAYAAALDDTSTSGPSSEGTGTGGLLGQALLTGIDELETKSSEARSILIDALTTTETDLEESLESLLEFGSAFSTEIATTSAFLSESLTGADPDILRRNVNSMIDALAGSDDEGPRSVEFRRRLAELAEQEGVPEAIREILLDVAGGNVDPQAGAQLLETINNVISVREAQRIDAEIAAVDLLKEAAYNEDPRLAGRSVQDIEDLIEDRRESDPFPGISLLEEFKFDEVNAQEDVERVRLAFANVKEQYEAGLISTSEFSAATADEIAELQAIIDSYANSGTSTGQEVAADAVKEYREARETWAELVISRLEADIEVAELIGEPVEGEELVGALINAVNTPEVQGSPGDLKDLATRIVEAEQQIALDLIAEAKTLEEAQAIIASFSLSPDASRAFTLSQVSSSEEIAQALTTAGVQRANFDSYFNSIADAIEAGASVDEAVADILRLQLTTIEQSLAAFGSGQNIGPRQDVEAAKARLEARKASIEASLGSLNLSGVRTGADVGLGEQDLSDLETASYVAQQEVLDGYEALEDSLSDLNVEQDLPSKARRVVSALQDSSIKAGSEQAIELSRVLIDIINQSTDLAGAELVAMNEAIAGVVGTAGQTAEEFAVAQLIFEALNNSQNVFNQFLSNYVTAGSSLFNSMLRQIADLVAAGVSAADAVRQVAREAADAMAAQIAQFSTGPGARFYGEEVASYQSALLTSLDELYAIADDPGFTAAVGSIPSVSLPNVGGGGGGGGGSGREEKDDSLKKAVEAYIDWRNAQFDYIAAQVELDPEAAARNELERAKFAYEVAASEADRLRAAADGIRARRSIAEAIQDNLQAQIELAIAVAESSGDFAGVLELGVDAAQARLDYLTEIGASTAEIKRAQAEVIRAEDAQADGLVRAELDELGFLFDLGDLSKDAYIAALKKVLAQLDPVGDVDLWRQITLQLKRLEESSSELQFNLPENFTLPTLYEVRRANQNGFGDSQTLGFGNVGGQGVNNDNRQVEVNIYVQTGMDWEEAKDVVGEAVGGGSNVFAINTKKY